MAENIETRLGGNRRRQRFRIDNAEQRLEPAESDLGFGFGRFVIENGTPVPCDSY
jgi:hypothetical protein